VADVRGGEGFLVQKRHPGGEISIGDLRLLLRELDVVVVDGLLGQFRQHLLFSAPGHDGLQLLMDRNLFL
jgi:hypothetical protein